jgi:hypothetical protein
VADGADAIETRVVRRALGWDAPAAPPVGNEQFVPL